MSNRPKALFLFNFITPYRYTFFEKLCSISEFQWLIVHGLKEKEDGRPAYKGHVCFPNQGVEYKETKLGPFHVRWQKGVIDILRESQPDIVITLGIPSILSNWIAMIWARIHGSKTITWHCGWEEQIGNRFSLPIKQILSRLYLSLADEILVYSSKGAKYLSGIQGGQSENITVCYNGLDIEPLLLEEEEIRKIGKELRIREYVDEKRVFLYVGGMIKEKQVQLLLNAFQQLQEPEKSILWLVGDGPDLPEIKNLVQSKKLRNVKIWGRVIDGVDSLFVAADYFVLPGLGGLALNQALFWGVPCVVGEADGTEDDLVIDGQTGFRFIPNDMNSLKIALQKCIDLPEDQKVSFGSAGRDLILKRSNVDEMIKTFVSTIRNMENEK